MSQYIEAAEPLGESVLKVCKAPPSKMVLQDLESLRSGLTKKTKNKKKNRRIQCSEKEMHGTTREVEGPGSDSSDESEEGPSTSAMSFPVQKSGMEMAVKFPSSSQRARALSTDSGSPEKLQSPVTDWKCYFRTLLYPLTWERHLHRSRWKERWGYRNRKPRRKRRQRIEVP